MESSEVSEEEKDRLTEGYERANPAQLKREITRLQNELIKISIKKEKGRDEKKMCV